MHPPLSKPSDINTEIDSQIRIALSKMLENLKRNDPLLPPSLRLREWNLVSREHKLLCEIFLDKGQSWLQYDDFKEVPGHSENQEIVTIEECLRFHRALLEDAEITSLFSESICFEVGSAGEKPPLSSLADFQHALGFMVQIQTWTKSKNRDRYRGRLRSVKELHGELQVTIESGEYEIHFEGSEIRRAFLLLFHPENFRSS